MQGAEAIITLPDNQNKSNRRGTHIFSIHCCMLLCTCQQTETPVPGKIKKKKSSLKDIGAENKSVLRDVM